MEMIRWEKLGGEIEGESGRTVKMKTKYFKKVGITR